MGVEATAVGTPRVNASRSEHATPTPTARAILYSADGVTWVQLAEPPAMRARIVTWFNGAWLVFGEDLATSSGASAWRSADAGQTWVASRLPASIGSVWPVAVSSAGLLAGDIEVANGAEVATSADGVTWKAHQLPSGPAPVPISVTAAHGEQLLVVGSPEVRRTLPKSARVREASVKVSHPMMQHRESRRARHDARGKRVGGKSGYRICDPSDL
jgi:hypothetical protein